MMESMQFAFELFVFGYMFAFALHLIFWPIGLVEDRLWRDKDLE